MSGFPDGSDSKMPTCNAVDPDSVPRLGRFPVDEHSNPLQYFCLENPHGQRILTGLKHFQPQSFWAFLIAQFVKNPPIIQENQVQFLGGEDPLEKG